MFFSTITHKCLILSLFLHLAISSPLSKRGPTCNDIVIPVTFSAMNARIPAGITLDPSSILNAIAALVFDLPISGTYDIAARYCEPEVVVASRTNTLQLLVHGATYTRNYCAFPSLLESPN
jgi:hypothetical protein